MRYTLLVAAMFLVGCVGSSTPHNPMNRCGTELWWQASTAGVTSNNPWNKFVRTHQVEDTSDPWANFQEPELFPEDFAPASKEKVEEALYPPRFRPILRDRQLQKLLEEQKNRELY